MLNREQTTKFIDWCIDQLRPVSVIDFNCDNSWVLESAYFKGIKSIDKLKGLVCSPFFVEDALNTEYSSFVELLDPKYYINFENQSDLVISLYSPRNLNSHEAMFFCNNVARSVSKIGAVIFVTPDEENGFTRGQWLEAFKMEGLKENHKLSKLFQATWQVAGFPEEFYRNIIVLQK